jgi:alanine dehydrogenase
MSQPKRIISTGFSYETLEETLDIKPKGARVHIGIPREILYHENRIALIPDAVSVLVNNGHEITIEHNAGEAAHYSDRDYSEAGARIVYQREEVYKAPVLVKSAPVMEEEIPFLQHNQMIISPIQLSALKAELLQKMMEKKITAISFENYSTQHERDCRQRRDADCRAISFFGQPRERRSAGRHFGHCAY